MLTQLLQAWNRYLIQQPYYQDHFIVQRPELAENLLIALNKDWSETITIVPFITEFVESTRLSSTHLMDSLFALLRLVNQKKIPLSRRQATEIEHNLQNLIIKLSSFFTFTRIDMNLPTHPKSFIRMVQNSTPQFELDSQFRFRKVNEALLQKFGYHKKELLHQHIRQLFTESSQTLLRYAQRQLQRGHRYMIRLEVEARSSKHRKFRAIVQIMRAEADDPDIAYTGLIQDVSESKETRDLVSLLSLALENVGDGIVVIEPHLDGKILYLNSAMEKLSGYERYQLYGKPFSTLLGKRVRKRILKEIFEESLKIGWKGELVQHHRNGDSYIVELHTKPVKDENGNIVAIVGIERDITEFKAAHLKILDLGRFIQQIINNLHHLIIVTDEHFRIKFWNESLARKTGFPEDEVIDRSLSEVLPQLIDSIPREIFRKSRKSAMLFNERLSLNLFSEEERHFQVSISHFVSATRAENLYLWVLEDITEAFKKDQHIRFLSKIPENSPILIFSLNLEGKVIYSNPTVTKTCQELDNGKTCPQKLLPSTLMYDIAVGDFTAGDSREYLHRIGERVFQYIAFRPEDLDFIFLYGIDITDRLELQNRLIQTERIRAMGEMAAGVAHDFNNLLAIILGRVQLLKLKTENQEWAQELEVIEKAAQQGSEIVQKLHETTRQKRERHFQPVSLSEVIRESLMFSIQKVKPAAQLQGKDVHIHTQLDDQLVVFGNPIELKELFTNLIFNAFDAMPGGGDLYIQSRRKDDDTVEIRVRDTGMGIPEEIIHRIFDPFFTTKGEKGTGLGLSLVYNIVTAHHGKINVNSEIQKGTEFQIELPLSKEALEHKPQPTDCQCDENGELRILVVDDELELLETTVEILRLQFKEVDMARNGEEAIEKFKKKAYDVVITDLGMPRISGWEVAREVKKYNPTVRTILITGWGQQAEAELKHHQYVDLVLSKPYDIQKLMEKIQKLSHQDHALSE
ncbi:MAG: PAS domain S-box protein [Calditrichaeota bacterium]|nr:PAS domain S-box protein [Calditrichota bacterium]